ncbi:hypothetical protein ACQPW3_25425 [Actinosynnema sp. CA-248983]
MTIMLGVLAVVGTVGGALGGQMIATRREDRRWAREAGREDLRWQRERQREQERFAHEARLHWREQRLTTYSAFIAAFDASMDPIVEAAVEVPAIGRVTDDKLYEAQAAVRALTDAYASVDVLASVDVRLVAYQLVRAAWHVVDDIRRGNDDSDRAEDESLVVRLRETRSRLLDVIREELAIDFKEFTPSPSPPSGPTS